MFLKNSFNTEYYQYVMAGRILGRFFIKY